MSRDDLLNALDAAFAELLAAVEGLSDKQMTSVWYGDWSVRDILAHIIGWHHETGGMLERMARGEKPAPEGTDYSDVDGWNARFVQTWRSASLPALLEELAASKASFAAAARQVPEERFQEGRTAYRLLQVTGINHCHEHASDIHEWREKEGI